MEESAQGVRSQVKSLKINDAKAGIGTGFAVQMCQEAFISYSF
jgi:hypothetical protein